MSIAFYLRAATPFFYVPRLHFSTVPRLVRGIQGCLIDALDHANKEMGVDKTGLIRLRFPNLTPFEYLGQGIKLFSKMPGTAIELLGKHASDIVIVRNQPAIAALNKNAGVILEKG